MAKKEKTMNIKRKDKYTFNEVLDIAMSLKLIEYTDVKKKTVDVTGTFVENYGMQHIPAMMVNQSLKAKGEQEYKVSDVMLVTYVDNILSEIKQPDNEALGGGLYNLFKNFPRYTKLAETVELVNEMSLEQATAELEKMGVKVPKSTAKKENLSYIG